MRVKEKTYICIDIEADGPLVGIHPMRAIGAVAMDERLHKLNQVGVNIAPHGETYPDTMKWWAKWPKARAELDNPPGQPPDVIIPAFVDWVKLHTNPIFVTDAPWFDYPWVRWYCLRFVGVNPFNGYFPYTWVARGTGIRLEKVHNPRPHVALDDAIEMAEQFKRFMLKWRAAKEEQV